MASTGPTAAASSGGGDSSSILQTTTNISLHQRSSSESSENGVQMTPAEARRFARRNLRHTSATPDLVTSLVRPPSPEAFYVTPEVHDRMRMGAYRRIVATPNLTSRTASPAANVQSERRSGPLLQPHQSSLDLPKKYGSRAVFDLYSLLYVSESDPNLLCPICHDPLVDPVTTPCDHTFCYRCIRRSIASSPSGTACPIDREPLTWGDCFSAARLIRTQLNCLVVKCPFSARGCTQELRREVVEKHATAECRYREYYCPDKDCTKKLSSKPTDEKCHHQQVACSLCNDQIEESQSDEHLLSCQRSKNRCPECWELVVRSEMSPHLEVECSGVEIGCPYQNLGCPIRVLRGQVRMHTLCCAFHPDTPSGIVIRSQRDIIQSYNDLGAQIRELTNQQVENNKTIEELRTLLSRQPAITGGDSSMSDSRTIQDLDAGFEEVHQNLTHLEARQSMWTMNQVMPIREEVTELRNNINMVRMHVNWLLSRSRDEGRIRAANSTGAAGAAIRRDSAGDGPLMMPERRRLSGTDMDIPRL